MVVKILAGQKDLSHMNSVLPEEFFIHVHQLNLTDGAERLLIIDIPFAAPFIDSGNAADSCARGDENNPFAFSDHRADLPDDVPHQFSVHFSVSA